MKKILLLFMLAISATSYAQFKASPNGIVSEDGKGYCVFEFEGLSAEELYKRAVNFVMSYYKNPDKVMSKQTNEMINIHAIESDAFLARKNFGIPMYASVHYNAILRFKDGKLRIDSPIIDRMPINLQTEVTFTGSKFMNGGVVLFKNNGKVNNQKAVDNLNNWLSDYVNGIIEYIKNEGNSIDTKDNDW